MKTPRTLFRVGCIFYILFSWLFTRANTRFCFAPRRSLSSQSHTSSTFHVQTPSRPLGVLAPQHGHTPDRHGATAQHPGASRGVPPGLRRQTRAVQKPGSGRAGLFDRNPVVLFTQQQDAGESVEWSEGAAVVRGGHACRFRRARRRRWGESRVAASALASTLATDKKEKGLLWFFFGWSRARMWSKKNNPK